MGTAIGRLGAPAVPGGDDMELPAEGRALRTPALWAVGGALNTAGAFVEAKYRATAEPSATAGCSGGDDARCTTWWGSGDVARRT